MLKSIKEFFEKVAYAGLKPQGGRPINQTPAAAKAGAAKSSGMSAVRAWVDSKINSGGPVDPLYLSSRTPAQKIKTMAMVGIPVAIVLGGVGLVLLGVFDHDSGLGPPPEGISNAEIASKMLPDLNKDLHIEAQHDLEVEDVHVVSGSPIRLVGVAKNTTDHAIARAELTFDLTDKTGSRQGAVTTELKNISSKTSVPFQFAIEQTSASFALVREVHIQ
jgi:hypothetical protein